jgi:hypothetical protein
MKKMRNETVSIQIVLTPLVSAPRSTIGSALLPTAGRQYPAAAVGVRSPT